MISLFFTDKSKRLQEKEQYAQTQRHKTYMPGHELAKTMSKHRQTGPTSKLNYIIPTIAGAIAFPLILIILAQFLASWVAQMPYWSQGKKIPANLGFWHNYGLGGAYFMLFILMAPILGGYLYKKTHAVWFNNNAMYLTDDMADHEDDAYIRSIDNLTQELEPAPDAGLGFDGHVSSIMSHIMVSNKGIKKVNMPQFDPNVDGYVKRDQDGKIVRKMVPMFDPEFANMLFSMSQVPPEFRNFFDARDYDFNRRLTKKEGGGKDKNGNWKRAGAYNRKAYDKLSDYINHEFYPLDTETQRPAGVYFYDSRPVNTILIAITRAGKGQTYLEPYIDLSSREKHPWNIFSTDPKGELLAKFYYPLTIRGFEIIQFNLMHPNLTNIFNPLANAIQAFRENNANKGTALIDSIVDTLFPDDNGEIWNPAAGNMFRRAVYLLFDYYIEQENYIRYLGRKHNVPQEIIDSEIDRNYSKVTLFNVYSLIGDLASRVSTDVKFINVNPEVPATNRKDFLTLIFDAMACLPANTLRSKAITANNAIKQIASAEQTIAGIYATLLTGLSVYADDTTIALMSGSLSETFDIAGLGFPRRVGIHFDNDYVKKFRITGELYKWSIYHDVAFTQPYEGKDYEHIGRVEPSNWVWGYFKGIPDKDVFYLKLEIESGSIVAKTFYFKFIKGYRTFDGITYITNPITHKKQVHGGTLIEIAKGKPESCRSEFVTKQIDILNDSYHEMTKPVITANQVFYSEQPKAVFAITPPHLQVYQKSVLVIIKQIMDEQYSNSYVVKKNRKPIVGTKMIFEEFGNIRSGKKGIPNIDTAASIALGQDMQLTFVLQSFQQLRAIYGEDIEKVLRANSSNTVFLKSNDKELIDELIRLSGSRHRLQQKSKSVSRKMGDMITVSEPVVNYSAEDLETTTLTSNDLLFLAGAAPGNAVVLSSGEMPIVNKLSQIMPMAAGLHRHLPEPKAGQYSDATMPTNLASDSINVLNNLIDGDALVRARVGQAKIWLKQLKPRVEQLIEREHLVVNERDGSLSAAVMNTVYELYDRQSGLVRDGLSSKTHYWEFADKLENLITIVNDTQQAKDIRNSALKEMLSLLAAMQLDRNLDDLTSIYADPRPQHLKKGDLEPIMDGYNPEDIQTFVDALANKYPKPEPIPCERRDICHNRQDPSKIDPCDIYDATVQGILMDHFADLISHDQPLGEGIKSKLMSPNAITKIYRIDCDDGTQICKLTFREGENGELQCSSMSFTDQQDQLDRVKEQIMQRPDLLEIVQTGLRDAE